MYEYNTGKARMVTEIHTELRVGDGRAQNTPCMVVNKAECQSDNFVPSKTANSLTSYLN